MLLQLQFVCKRIQGLKLLQLRFCLVFRWELSEKPFAAYLKEYSFSVSTFKRKQDPSVPFLIFFFLVPPENHNLLNLIPTKDRKEVTVSSCEMEESTNECFVLTL